MRVCLLNDSFPPVIDGVANVVMNYAKIMTEELGAQVVVGTPRYPDGKYDGYPYRVIDYPSINTTKLVAGYRTGNPLAMREIQEMARFGEEADQGELSEGGFGPQIIHSHCPASSTIMGRILQNATGAPLIFTYHTKFDVDIARAVGEGVLKHEAIKAMVKNISACDEVWVVSRGAAANLQNLGFAGECRVMHNGVDYTRGRASQEMVQQVTKEFDLPADVPMYLFVGRMMKYKGLPIIIDAMKKLSENGYDYRCVFVGGGADAEEMQKKVREYGISMDIRTEDGKMETVRGGDKGRIIFAGAVHDREVLRAWYTRADLFLFPSTYDTNGIVVREAAACGLGTVLISGSCAAEDITDGRNGYLTEENADAMYALLSRLHSRMEDMHEVGRHAMEEIYISWEESVREAYRRYEEILEMAENGELMWKKKHLSDRMLEVAAEVAEGTDRIISIPHNLYVGVKGNVNTAWNSFVQNMTAIGEDVEELGETIRGIGEKVSRSVKEKVAEHTPHFLGNAKSDDVRKKDE